MSSSSPFLLNTHERTNARTHERTNARTHERTNARTHENNNSISILKSYLFMLCLFLAFSEAKAQGYCHSTSPPNYSGLTAPCINSCDLVSGEYIVRVYVHIVQKMNGTGAQTLADVNNALNILMNDFAPHGIYFSLIGRDYLPVSDDLYDFKNVALDYISSGTPSQIGWDEDVPDLLALANVENCIDIFFMGPNVLHGGDALSIPGAAFALGGNINGMPVTSNTVISHEMGHCLGLLHTFHGEADACMIDVAELGCADSPLTNEDDCDCGDNIPDTAPDPYISRCFVAPDCTVDFNIPAISDLCEACQSSLFPLSYPNPPLNNIMSYSVTLSSVCNQVFTPGQASRMKCLLSSPGALETVKDDVIRIGFPFTMTSPKNCFKSILIEPGGRLTVANTTLTMRETASLTVKPGGRLLVNGSTLTGCNEGTWKGVVVEGNAGSPQYPVSNQGFVDFSGNSLLENAERSFDVKAGGIVRTLHTTVRNCGGAKFAPYPGFNTWSNFKHTDFVLDGDTYPFNQFKEHAFLENIKTVGFNYCDFTTLNLPLLPASIRQNLRAINALDAGFSVNNCQFDGHYMAVAAGTGLLNPANTFSIKNCLFKNNFYGIHSLGIDFFTVLDNYFEVKNNYPYPGLTNGLHVGLAMENSTGFIVRENTFRGVAGMNARTYGILVENSGSAGNMIEVNDFDLLAVGNQAQGNNRGPNTGLQYLCNYNPNANTRDFYVIGDGSGIAEFQGAGLAARNTFSPNASNTFIVDSDFRNEAGEVIYFHSAFQPEVPEFFFEISPEEVTGLNPCPGDVNPEPVCCEELSLEEIEAHELAYTTAKNAYESQLSDLLTVMDGGNTNGLLSSIAGLNTSNRLQVKQSLIASSPWLSHEVLAALIGKIGVFSEPWAVEVLSANPDQVRKSETRNLVLSALSPSASASVLSSTSATGIRTELEIALASFRSEFNRHADILIRDILADTLVTDLGALRVWLHNSDHIEADYAVAEAHMFNNEQFEAYQQVDLIEQKYELTPEQLEAHRTLKTMFDMFIAWQSAGTPISGLDAMQTAELEVLATWEKHRARTIARSILNAHYGYNYRVVPKLPSGNGSQGLIIPPSGEPSFLPTNAPIVTAYPNPASDNVTFKWQTQAELLDGKLYLFDLHGRLVETLSLEGRFGKSEFSTHHLEAGIYWFRAVFNDEETEVTKLVLIK